MLQISFAWSGEHLYRFTVHGREFGSGELWLADPSRVCLADLGLRERERFTYAYDFFSPLQCWSHDLRVEAISPSRPRRRYPWCTGLSNNGTVSGDRGLKTAGFYRHWSFGCSPCAVPSPRRKRLEELSGRAGRP